MQKIKTYRDLEIWQKGILIVKDVYSTTEKFPTSETYGLSLQMRRAAISIPSNVAEGFRRNSNREFNRYLSIAQSSVAELETQIIIACELKYIDAVIQNVLLESTDHISRMITNLCKRL
jgi:four helix bundle protein